MKRIIIIIISVILVIATIVMGVLLYKKVKDQEEQIQVLEQQIQTMSIEDLVDVYVAAQPIKSGTNVTETQFQLRKWDRKYMSPNMVTDISDIKDKVWKIDVATEGPITRDMIAEETFGPTDRLQLVGVDAISPSLEAGDYVDIRMITPSGINYVVMAKKRVNRLYDSGLEIVMSEAELMVYSGLVLDQFAHPGTMVYTSKYLEPTLQKSNYTMYVPPKNVLDYMNVNANMIYPYLASDDVQGLRSYIESTQPWNLYGPSTFRTQTEAIIHSQERASAANEAIKGRMEAARSEYLETAGTEGAPSGTSDVSGGGGGASGGGGGGESVGTQANDVTGGNTSSGTGTNNGTGTDAQAGGAEQTYIDADGVERMADGTPVIQPGDLVTGIEDVREGNGVPNIDTSQ